MWRGWTGSTSWWRPPSRARRREDGASRSGRPREVVQRRGRNPARNPRPFPPPNCPLNYPQALRAARDEVRAALEHAEQALDHLDAARRLEPVILAGPEADVDAFLDALSALDAAAAYLTRAKDVAAAPPALDGVLALRRDGLALALRNFGTLLRLHAADVDGDRGVDTGYGLAGEDGQDGGETPPLRAPSDESGGRWSSGRSELVFSLFFFFLWKREIRRRRMPGWVLVWGWAWGRAGKQQPHHPPAQPRDLVRPPRHGAAPQHSGRGGR